MKNPLLDDYFAKADRWAAEMAALREICLASGLSEERKWYQACYCLDGANVVIISSFKTHVVLGFFKGSLLSDPAGILELPGPNSQSSRFVRLTSVEEVTEKAPLLTAYLAEAMALERAGAKVTFTESRDFPLIDELVQAFAEVPGLEAAFRALTPGRQRAYHLHFSGAKQSATRGTRIAKSTPYILAGKGWNER